MLIWAKLTDTCSNTSCRIGGGSGGFPYAHLGVELVVKILAEPQVSQYFWWHISPVALWDQSSSRCHMLALCLPSHEEIEGQSWALVAAGLAPGPAEMVPELEDGAGFQGCRLCMVPTAVVWSASKSRACPQCGGLRSKCLEKLWFSSCILLTRL